MREAAELVMNEATDRTAEGPPRPEVNSPKVLLDREGVKGLNMGLDTPGISTFWHTLNHFYSTGKRHWLMKLNILFVYMMGFSYCLLCFAALFFIDMDIKRGIATVISLILGLQSVFKCWTFSYSTEEYLKLFAFLKKDFISCVPPEKVDAVKIVVAKNVSATNKFVKYAILWNVAAVFTVSSAPFLRSQAFREFFHLGEGPIVPNKIFENEYPFEWNSSPTYELIWVFELVFGILGVAMCSAYQAILLFLVMALVGHLKVLGYVMRELKAADFTEGTFGRINGVAKAKGYRQLINCIKDHQKIVAAGDALAERYNTFLTFHLGTAIIVGILSIFNCTAADGMSDKVKYAIMCVYGLLEVAIYCICGQLLQNASEDVLRQVYQCEWEEMEPKFRKAAQLMMVRANTPITLTAGRIYQVNLETLAAIQQLVYSALTMLSSLIDGNS